MYKLLLVDDEPMIRKGLFKLIQKYDEDQISEIQTAENGAEALELIEVYRPDFVLTDIRMPKVDGIELCRIVSEKYPYIHLVIVTGYDDFEYARKSILYGVTEYILKPITRKGIEDMLHRLIERARKKEGSSLSLAQFHQWLNQMEEAIWTMDEEQITLYTDEMFTRFRQNTLSLAQQKRHVAELSQLLNERLNSRDVYPIQVQYEDQNAQRVEELENCFRSYIAHIVGFLREKRKGKIKDPVEVAKQFIEENLSRDFSLEEVAERIGLNASYFSQLFKQKTGETFAQYRIRRRMEKAKHLLAIPHQKITDVSFEVGYADHPHFTKTFKKVIGCTPSEYRQQLGIDP